MKIKHYSLRTHLILGISLFAILIVVLLFASEILFREMVYRNYQSYTQELVNQKAVDLLKELEVRSKELGLSLQRDSNLRTALEEKDAKALTQILNNQFNQYFVTAGIADLKRLSVYDKKMTLIAESTVGLDSLQGERICKATLGKVKLRTGPSRVKMVTALCELHGHAYQIVIVPVGGLKVTGYLEVVTDPVFNLQGAEKGLGMPVMMSYLTGEVAYQSLSWPDEKLEDYFLKINTHLIGSDRLAVLNISVARDIKSFEDNLSEMQWIVLMLVLLFVAPASALAIYKLQTAIRSLSNLRDASEQLSKGEYVHISDKTYPEIEVVIDAYNSMSEKITSLIKELEGEISHRKEIEGELLKNKQELEVARDAAISASKSKSTFLANMSHEIRTPLTAIIGFSESLLDAKRPVQERIDSIYTIIRSSKHLLSIINDLLDLSKVEADKLEIEHVPLNPFEVVNDVKSVVELMADDKGLEFNVEYQFPLPLEIESDPLRLKQILLNLCNNAIKFTSQGMVRLVMAYDAEAGLLRFNVIDTGIGMTDEQKNKIFQPFTQADSSTTRRFGGTGLGLHLSKWLVEKMGGSLSVDSAFNVGSNFIFTIACGKLPQELLTNNCPELKQLDSPVSLLLHEQDIPQLEGHVLLAEDNRDNQKLICMYFENAGVNTVVVNNGQDAVSEVLNNEYDLVFLDIQMPLLSGIDAVKQLREQGYNGPVIALTANVMKDEIEHYLAVGFNEHFAKPIDQMELYNLLERYLQKTSDSKTDEDKINSHLDGRSEKLDKIILGFVDNIPMMLQEILTAFRKEEYAALREAVHALKGVSGNYGFDELYKLLFQLEEEVKQGNIDVVGGMIEKAEQINRAIQNAYKDKLKPSNVTPLHRR